MNIHVRRLLNGLGPILLIMAVVSWIGAVVWGINELNNENYISGTLILIPPILLLIYGLGGLMISANEKN